MSKKCLWCVVALGCLMTAPVIAQSTPVCGPLDDGRVANVFYEGTAVFFEPIVEYAYDVAVLTISGPCEDIVRTFKREEEIFFDIRDIERVTDGQYTWQLRFEPTIDKGVQEDLHASRGTGEEDDVWWHYWQKGAIPVGPRVDSASFRVFRGSIIDPDSGEEKSASLGAKGRTGSVAAAAAGAVGGSSSVSGEADGPSLGTKDQVIPDDLIVQASLCVGFDCVNGESFSFDTIRLKENNLRIKFQDTSGGSFPTRDWEIEANSSANGGQTHFRVNDVDASRSPFTIEGNSPSHSLYVDSSGRVGFGTSTPVTELHVANGDTPTLRLDQNTSSGFAAQVWDVAGNETNFFVRDATNGSTLPFRIQPGASSNRVFIDDNDNVGIGTSSPSANLTVSNNGLPVTILLEDTSASGVDWEFKVNTGGGFAVNDPASAGGELILTSAGDLTIEGDYFSATCTAPGSPCAPDYVFEPDYELLPLDELKEFVQTNRHLPNVPSESDLRAAGQINLSKFQLTLLEKIEELTLYTLSLHEENGELQAKLAELEAKVEGPEGD